MSWPHRGRRHRKRCRYQGGESYTLFNSGKQSQSEMGSLDLKAEILLIESAVRKGDFGSKGNLWARTSMSLILGSLWMLKNHPLFLL